MVMNLQDQILTKIAKEMQEAIDQDVMWNMLKAQGWTCVSISRFQDNKHAIDITYWLEENVKNYERNGRDFIFKSKKDAVNFILKWV